MKKITLVLLALAMALGMNLSAQDKYGPNKDECIKYLSYYQEYYKAKNYDDALPNWRTAMKLCPPTASQNMLLNGMTLLSREINKTKDAGARKALVDSLLMLNDLRAEYYPNYAVAAMNTKGQYMTQFFKDPKTLYEGLGQIVAANKEQTKPSLLLLQLNSAIDMFKDGNLGAEEVINTYQNAIALIGKAEQTEDVVKTKGEIMPQGLLPEFHGHQDGTVEIGKAGKADWSLPPVARKDKRGGREAMTAQIEGIVKLTVVIILRNFKSGGCDDAVAHMEVQRPLCHGVAQNGCLDLAGHRLLPHRPEVHSHHLAPLLGFAGHHGLVGHRVCRQGPLE